MIIDDSISDNREVRVSREYPTKKISGRCENSFVVGVFPRGHLLLYPVHLVIMAKQPATIYVCQNCGSQSRKWLGQCPDCSEWNTMVEERFRPSAQNGGSGYSGIAR